MVRGTLEPSMGALPLEGGSDKLSFEGTHRRCREMPLTETTDQMRDTIAWMSALEDEPLRMPLSEDLLSMKRSRTRPRSLEQKAMRATQTVSDS